MSVREVVGNLFNARTQCIVNTVNTRGVMGKGIALEFKQRFPDMFKDYRLRCQSGLVHPGETYLFKASHPWVLNFPTKDHWRYPSRLTWIDQGLSHFARHYREWGVTSIAFPQLGTQNGGLKWAEVQPLMIEALSPLDLEVLIYTYGVGDEAEIGLDWLNAASVEDIAKRLALKPALAEAIAATRSASGSLKSFQQLHQVKGIGPKMYSAIVARLGQADTNQQQKLL